MLLGNTFHTTYCTNIHPGQDWETTFNSLRSYLPKVRQEMGVEEAFGIGLRLSNQASIELGKGSALAGFKEWLADNDFYVFTMNGFPYGPFHGTNVKAQVHAPDWTREERYTYTERLFEQLAELLPSGIDGGISTSPVGYKHWYLTEADKHNALKKAAAQMAGIALKLYRLEETSGTYLHLDIEPEPDGLLESTREFVSFFKEYLIPTGSSIFKTHHGIEQPETERILKRHINLCYDICHFALGFENPEDVFDILSTEGIRTGKIQVSAALKADLEKVQLPEIIKALKPFDEPVYLHQVRLIREGRIVEFKDLGDYLNSQVPFDELRSHYHVPIFIKEFGLLQSTQEEVLKVLNYLREHPVCSHLEVETYTWEVLPEGLKQNLDVSISRELKWLTKALVK